MLQGGRSGICGHLLFARLCTVQTLSLNGQPGEELNFRRDHYLSDNMHHHWFSSAQKLTVISGTRRGSGNRGNHSYYTLREQCSFFDSVLYGL